MVVTEKHLPEPVFEVARIFPEKLEESEKYSPEPVLEAICLFQERLEKPVLSPGTAIPSVRLSELRPKERLAGRMSLVHLEPGLVEGPFSLNSEVPDRWKMPEVNMRCPQCILLCLGKYWKGFDWVIDCTVPTVVELAGWKDITWEPLWKVGVEPGFVHIPCLVGFHVLGDDIFVEWVGVGNNPEDRVRNSARNKQEQINQ